MLIQALFSREGGPIHHSIGRFAYVFEKNERGDYVAPVFSGEHREMMCRSGNFRLYVDEPAEVDDMPVGDEADTESEPEGKRVKRRRPQ